MAVGITLLGPDIDHRRSLEAMLTGHFPLNWVRDSNSALRSAGGGWPRRMRHRIERVIGTRHPDYMGYVQQALQANKSQIVVAYWGTEPLADLIGLRRMRPDVKLVLMVLCYPVALDSASIKRQNWMMRRAARVLDGILFPNVAMRDHFIENGLLAAGVPQLILPPCWPASFQAAGVQPDGLDRPNVVFIGRTDLSSSTVHAADDLRPMMRELLDAGIQLHHGRSRETDDGHPLRRPFDPVSQDQLIERMACHDASLIAYNLAACGCDARFELTVPDRLISSVAAGVPLALPSRGYTGSQQYLAGHEALVRFDDPSHLLRLLSDRGRVRAMREAAWASRPRFAAEHHGAMLRSFLAALV